MPTGESSHDSGPVEREPAEPGRGAGADDLPALLGWQPETIEAGPGRARRTLGQLVAASAVLVVVAGALLTGAIVLAGPLLPPQDASQPYCNPITEHCVNTLNLVAVETQTGFEFPPGSELVESNTRTGDLLHPAYRSLSATVRMPAGADLPTSPDPLSSIRVTGEDGDGSRIVKVTTSNGR
ncbi:hypothetical protein [Herbiconiux solani]|uniref:hypothetical protein n=1 Tax=Herbiconiux solani TaxID=661329 RepID=UPI000824344D|nr:hypothetical protein [Herbiconiux solani]